MTFSRTTRARQTTRERACAAAVVAKRNAGLMFTAVYDMAGKRRDYSVRTVMVFCRGVSNVATHQQLLIQI